MTQNYKVSTWPSNEIESLRQQLAYLQEELGNPPTDFHLLKQQLSEYKELLAEAYADADDVLRPQLAECERERDELSERIGWCNAELNDKDKQLASVTKERDELLAGMQDIGDFSHDRSTGPAVEDSLWEVRRMAYEWIGTASIARVGADKTGEK